MHIYIWNKEFPRMDGGDQFTDLDGVPYAMVLMPDRHMYSLSKDWVWSGPFYTIKDMYKPWVAEGSWKEITLPELCALWGVLEPRRKE